MPVIQAKRATKEVSEADGAEVLGLVEPMSTDSFLEATLAKRLSRDDDGFHECLVALRKVRDAVGQLREACVGVDG